jgi:asparagine synthase (glutamine-hydrolysing)
MCGIVGAIYEPGVAWLSDLRAAQAKLAHRGPDSKGHIYREDIGIGIAHTRLAVQDLSDAGSQPMKSLCGRYAIVYNGELYNSPELRAQLASDGFVFRGASDTEVLLYACMKWGTGVGKHLDGMFAFAYIDFQRQAVTLYRDRAGEKPLYYWTNGNHIAFASELTALLRLNWIPRVLEKASLSEFLCFGYNSESDTLIRGIKRLKPGSFLHFNRGIKELDKYWALPSLSESAGRAEQEDLVEVLDYLLESSVRRQLLSDVPMGVLLSGGVDSSLITAYASKAVGTRLKTFHVFFGEHQGFNESAHARFIARHFETDHTELSASDSDSSLFDKIALGLDEPIGDGSLIPSYVVASLIKKHCTVALGGDGADELFGGYREYTNRLRVSRYCRIVPNCAAIGVNSLLKIMPSSARGRGFLGQIAATLSHPTPVPPTKFDRIVRGRLLKNFNVRQEPELRRIQETPDSKDIVEQLCRNDFQHYLPGDILAKVDRAAMLNSLEVRSPFLDRKVIEFAFGEVPSVLKCAGSKRKILLKALASKRLPRGFDLNRKQGFGAPIASWIGTTWRPVVSDALQGLPKHVFDRGHVDALSKAAQKNHMSERILTLAFLGAWFRNNRISTCE